MKCIRRCYINLDERKGRSRWKKYPACHLSCQRLHISLTVVSSLSSSASTGPLPFLLVFFFFLLFHFTEVFPLMNVHYFGIVSLFSSERGHGSHQVKQMGASWAEPGEHAVQWAMGVCWGRRSRPCQHQCGVSQRWQAGLLAHPQILTGALQHPHSTPAHTYTYAISSSQTHTHTLCDFCYSIP